MRREVPVPAAALMFDVYDTVFFDGRMTTVLADRPLTFRLARRATSRGGSLRRFRARTAVPGLPPEWFQMTVSTSLLFDSFGPTAGRSAGARFRWLVTADATCGSTCR